MKLYATTTSERASKGQGGNKFLEIEILAERIEGIPTRTNIYRLRIDVNKDNELEASLLDYSSGQTQNLINFRGTPKKGKEQEGWGDCNHYATHENGLCVRCGYNTLGLTTAELAKGNQQKGEFVKCEHYGCGNAATEDSDYCIIH